MRSPLHQRTPFDVRRTTWQRTWPWLLQGALIVGLLAAVGWLVLRGDPGGEEVHAPADEEAPPAESVTLRGHEGDVVGVGFTSGGAGLVTASADGTVRLWAATGGNEIAVFRGKTGEAYTVMALSPSARHVAVAAPGGHLWQVDLTASPLRARPLSGAAPGQEVLGLAYSPDGNTLAVGRGDGAVALVQGPMGQTARTLGGGGVAVQTLAYGPRGGTLAVGGADGAIQLWDAIGFRPLERLRGHAPGPRIPDGRNGPAARLSALAFAADGRTLASGGGDRTVRLWRLDTRQALATFPHDGPVTCVAWRPDGALLASGTADGTVHVWNTATGKGQVQLAPGEGDAAGPVRALAFQPSGSRLGVARGMEVTVIAHPIEP